MVRDSFRTVDDGVFRFRLCKVRDKNSSGDEIANVNFYAVRPEGTRIR